MMLKDANFKRLFELSGDAMMILGRDTFLYCNPATLNIFACRSMDLFCSRHPSDFSPEFQPCGRPSRELAQQHIEEALRTGYERFEWVHKRLNGEEFYADVLLSTGVWQGEDVIQAIVRDISSYKALQDSLTREKEQSELATRAKSEFLAVMSHEIRTPIHGILGALELLQDSSLVADQRQLVDIASDSTRHLLSIVNDVLDFSKIDAGKLLLEAVPFSPQALLNGLHKQFSFEAQRKAIDLSLASEPLDSAAPDTGEGQLVLLGDAHRIQQILANLLSNAIKFTDRGGKVTLSSRLSPGEASSQGYLWHLSVSDTGIGMTASQQAAAFDVFEQADSSTSRRYGGTGLGLSISKALTELLGGTIELHSEVDSGTVFSLALPLPAAPADAVLPEPLGAGLQRDYGKSVLVAEDNPTNRFIIERKLARLGLQSVLVADGAAALAQYDASLDGDGRSAFAAILMDIQMPVMNGIEAARALQSRGCRVPVFALSADVQSDSRRLCLQAGIREFIGKPYEEQQLVGLFDRYFGAAD